MNNTSAQESKMTFRTDGLEEFEIAVLNRIDWPAVNREIGLDPGKLSENVLHQLARGTITDFVYANAVRGEVTANYERTEVSLQIPSKALGKEAREINEPIRLLVHNHCVNPQIYINGQEVLDQRRREYAMEKRVEYKYKKDNDGNLILDENNNPIFDLDANGNVIVLGERYLNANLGEVVSIMSRDGQMRDYIVGLDHEKRTPNGYVYRGTNKLVAVSVDSVKDHIKRMMEAMEKKNGDYCGHKLTESELDKLCRSQTVVANDFVNSQGETYIAGIQYDPIERCLQKVYNKDVARYRMFLAKNEKQQNKAQASQSAGTVQTAKTSQAAGKPAQAQPKAQETRKSTVKRS